MGSGIEKQRRALRLFSAFGPSGETRTPGLMVPKLGSSKFV